MLVAPGDLPEYTKLATAAVTQRQMIPTETPLTDLRFALESLFEGIHTVTSLGGGARRGRGKPAGVPEGEKRRRRRRGGPRGAAAPKKGQGGGGEGGGPRRGRGRRTRAVGTTPRTPGRRSPRDCP